MKKVPLSKTDRLVIESLIRQEHHKLMQSWLNCDRPDQPAFATRNLQEHYEAELRRVEHVANSMGFGPL